MLWAVKLPVGNSLQKGFEDQHAGRNGLSPSVDGAVRQNTFASSCRTSLSSSMSKLRSRYVLLLSVQRLHMCMVFVGLPKVLPTV